MGTKTINQLGVVTGLANDDKVAVWDTSAAATKAISIANLKTAINASFLATTGATTGASSQIQTFTNGVIAGVLRVGTVNTPVDSTSILNGGFEVGATISQSYRGMAEVDANTFSLHSNQYYQGSWQVYDTSRAPASIVLVSNSNDSYIDFKTKASNSGQATMRVRIDKNGSLRAGENTDTTHYLGRAAIGYDGVNSDHATFCHIDNNTDLKWALRQYPNGQTRMNSAAGQYVAIGVGGNPIFIVGAEGPIPNIDNTYDLGAAAYRWDDIYATNGTIQTSDERQKTAIANSDLGLDFIRALRPVRYVWRSTEEKTYSRPHYGLVAQEVQSAMKTLGIADFAGFIHSKTEESDAYGLRYTEFIAPIIAAIQELATEVTALKQR